jgi:hypothetical protein
VPMTLNASVPQDSVNVSNKLIITELKPNKNGGVSRNRSPPRNHHHSES